MATPAWVPLASTTLSSSASSVTFGSIPSGYRDLVVVINWTNSSSTGSNVGLRFNSDSGSNYPHVAMYGDGSSTNYASGTQPYAYVFYGATTAEQMATVQVLDASATDKHKTSLSRSGGGSYRTYAWASRWANTSAITSIEVLNSAVNFSAGSTFSLWGRNAL